MPKAYVIADIEVTDSDTYEDYKRLSGAAAEQYGGRFVVRGGAVDVLEGSWAPGRFVVIEFDDEESARRWYESPEYSAARDVRQSCSTGSLVLVRGS